jgi:co-chaperonin GroES (HSP10)
MIRPRGDLVLVRVLKSTAVATDGGIVIPDSLKRDFVKAEVVDTGPGRYLESGVRAPADDLNIGQIVLVLADIRGPQGQIIRKNLIPVSPQDDLMLVPESNIYAVEAN